MIKKFFKGLLFTIIYLIIGFVSIGLTPTPEIGLIVFGIWLISPLILLFIKVWKKEWNKKTKKQQIETKRNLIILLITLIIIAILIPLFIFAFIPLFDYIANIIIDFFMFLFAPNIIGYALIN